jgi:hypothetical protein
VVRVSRAPTSGINHQAARVTTVAVAAWDALIFIRLGCNVAFWRQNPQMGYGKINDVRASTFLFSVMCDSAPETVPSPSWMHIYM